MNAKKKLNPDEREFLYLVRQAAFSNPFSAERQELDRRFAGSADLSGDPLLRQAVSAVRERVRQFEAEGKADLRDYRGEDRELIRATLLYDVYHRHLDDFDALIRTQISAGDEPCVVHFADHTLDLLQNRGFSAEEARHYFAFFYQLRRAFYFIHHSLVGRSASMEQLRCRLWNTIFTYDTRWYEHLLWDRLEDFSVFLLGETGTGKGTAAAAIGRSGFIPFDEKKKRFAESFTRNFISINLSQFPEALIESELFGHRKGAFTGAVEDHQGVFARCRPHGAIFLDEIGDVSVPVQIKLLKVLQERTFSMVGGHATLRFEGRVIAATNQPLAALRRQGTFRDDFYYRLCSDLITVPPLRQQIREDSQTLPLLLEHTITRIVGQPAPDLASMAETALRRELGEGYPWPGNVRELEQAVRRVLLTNHYEGERREGEGTPEETLRKGVEEETLDAQGLLGAYCTMLYQRHGTYETVARIVNLDRRTVKKYLLASGDHRIESA